MPRVTKSVTARAKHKKVLKALKDTLEREVDFIKLLNNLILSHFSMHLEIEKIKKDPSDHYGFLELMQAQET